VFVVATIWLSAGLSVDWARWPGWRGRGYSASSVSGTRHNQL